MKSEREVAIFNSARRILFLRISVTCGLLATAAIVGSVSYVFLRSKEGQLADSRYDQITQNVQTSLEQGFVEKNGAIQSLAKSYAYTNVNSSEWPNVALPGFYDIAESLRHSMGFRDISFIPLVLPEQLPDFEPFIFKYFKSEPSITSNTDPPGKPWLGEVVFSVDLNLPEAYYRDTTGETRMFESANRILTPITQLLFSEPFTAAWLGFNLHSVQEVGPAIDYMINCSKTMNYTEATDHCSSMSAPFGLPFYSAVANDFQSLLLQPIYLDQDSDKFVGVVAGGITWKDLLQQSFPQYVEGVDCVVVHGEQVFTFTTTDDGVVLLGVGDKHDRKYDSYKREACILGGVFMLYFYPNDEYFARVTTDHPLYVGLGSVILILLCSGIFLLYDLLMRRESTAKTAVLNTKRRFVRFISHEVRTPLNAVHLGLEALAAEMAKALTLLDSFLAPPAKLNPAEPSPPPLSVIAKLSSTLHSWQDLTAEMASNSESAVDVLNDLLNYDKIEMGTLRLDFALVNIWETVKASTVGFQSHARDKHITMTLSDGNMVSDAEANSSEYIVVGDSVRLAQLMRNLISNALKFTPSNGQVSITVERLAGGLPGPTRITVPPDRKELLVHPRAGSVRISVTDSGAGLSPQQLEEIGAEGVQFNANQLQAGGGSGLGLFISKGLAEQHGGKLTVTSDGLGAGTTFTIELPLFLATASLHPAGAEPEAGTPRAFAQRQKPRSFHVAPEAQLLLLVDDAPSNRKILKRLLTSKGYICEMAEDGQRCLEVYLQLKQAGREIAAIVMDYEMPVMNGPTATKKLREMGCDVPIIGVTGNVLSADIDFYLASGANAVLGKPFNNAKFEALMSHFAGGTVTVSAPYNVSKRLVVPAESDAASACDTVLDRADTALTLGASYTCRYAAPAVQEAESSDLQ